jgi:hypothetical protein
MPDPRKLLAAKKAAILEQAQRQAAEIDHDLQELERLSSKYGLEFAQSEAKPDPSKEAAPKRAVRNADSPYYRGKMIAETLAEETGRPVPMASIWAAMLAAGVKIPGEPVRGRAKFSAYLGGRSRLKYIKDAGWWFKDRPLPRVRLQTPWTETEPPEDVGHSGGSRPNGHSALRT